MAVYNIVAGHSEKSQGASGYLNEVKEDRRIKDALIEVLRAAGETVYDCTSDAEKSGTCLSEQVSACNKHKGIDVHIHFNANAADKDDNTTGTEVFIYSDKSEAKDEAQRVLDNLVALGFRRRDVKVNSALYVLKNSKNPAMLIEVCFVDDKDDAKLYNELGPNKIASAIANGLTGRVISDAPAPQPAPQPAPAVSPQPAPAPAPQPKPNKPAYVVGKVYTLQVELKVRTGAGTNYKAKKYEQLTANGRKCDKDGDGALDKGTRITCQGTKTVGNDIWVKCPSGWIAAYYNGKSYVK